MPRGGLLNPSEKASLLVWPVPNPSDGHYNYSFDECLSMTPRDARFTTPDGCNPVIILKTAAEAKGKVDVSPTEFVALFSEAEIQSLASRCVLSSKRVRDSLLHIQLVKLNRKAGAITAAAKRRRARK